MVMMSVSLSRWSMSYFAAALLFLVTAEFLMACGYGFPHAALQEPETLILVHIVAIGWLSLLMSGVLFQFVPALVAYPLHHNALPLPTLGLLVAGLGGWLTFTAVGVSYRLLSVFMLAPELDRRSTQTALRFGAAALFVAVAGGLLSILLGGNLAVVSLVAGGLGFAALVLYGTDALHLYRVRKRRNTELNSRMTAFALASLGASVLLIGALLAVGKLGTISAPSSFLSHSAGYLV